MQSSQAAKLYAIVFLLVLSLAASTSEPEVIGTNRVRRSDDDSLESLKTVVEQQAAVIQTQQAQLTSQQAQLTSLLAQLTSQHAKVTSLKNTLQTKVTSLENNLQTLHTKVDVTSTTVAFSARMSQDPVAIGLHQTLVFDHAVTNVGNAYNSHTGIFTAPVAGTYAFFLSLMGTDTNADFHLAISKNGATLDLVYAQGAPLDHNDQGSSLVSTHLDKGDQVWVRQEQGDTIRGAWYTIFTGYLIQAQ